jgi:DNA modification methylase
MLETGKIINGDCIDEMSKFPENTIDLIENCYTFKQLNCQLA